MKNNPTIEKLLAEFEDFEPSSRKPDDVEKFLRSKRWLVEAFQQVEAATREEVVGKLEGMKVKNREQNVVDYEADSNYNRGLEATIKQIKEV